MTPDELGFLAKICAEPEEDTHRLVFADWLDDRDADEKCPRCHGDRMVEQHHDPASDTWRGGRTCPNCSGSGRLKNGFRYRAMFIRRQLACEVTQIPLSLLVPFEAVLGAQPHSLTRYAEPGYSIAAASARGRLLFRRGFLDGLKSPADVWLEHHERLCWSPTQTVACVRCAGTGWVKKRYKFGGPREPIEWRRAACTECEKGRVPRPCPETAQPITKVVITQLPADGGKIEELADKYLIAWPLTEDMHTRQASWDATLEMFRKEWPGIEFTSEGLGSSTPPGYADPFPDVPWGGGL